jgi:diacylglycerol kinase family enzyme
MYLYIYDQFLNSNKYSGLLAKIETRITDLGISGKILRFNPTTNIYNTLNNEIKRQTKTIIIVGNDYTIHETINAIENLRSKSAMPNICLGIIPIGEKDNNIANILGIEKELLACEPLAMRRIKKIDVGVANKHFFISELSITSLGTTVEIGGRYKIESCKKGIIEIINLADNKKNKNSCKINPEDDKLELVINNDNGFLRFSNKDDRQSVFVSDNFYVFNENEQATLDGVVKILTPVLVKMSGNKINFIVGKNRKF